MHLSIIYVITLLIETASELDILIYEGRHFLRYNVSVYKKTILKWQCRSYHFTVLSNCIELIGISSN